MISDDQLHELRKRIAVEALTEYRQALANNRSAETWGKADYLFDIDDWVENLDLLDF